jgi:hypothetical protein
LSIKKKAKQIKILVSERALIARINRKLAKDNQKLCHSRSAQTQSSVGEYYIIDAVRNGIIHQRVGPESLAKELGVLKPWEKAV